MVLTATELSATDSRASVRAGVAIMDADGVFEDTLKSLGYRIREGEDDMVNDWSSNDRRQSLVT